MNKKIIISLFFILSFLLKADFCLASTDIYNDKSPNLKNYTIFIPQGLKVHAVLSDELNSNNAIVGQVVNVYLLENFKYKNTIIAKAGSTISGTVTKNKKASNMPAQTTVRFTSIRTPYNNMIPISAMFETADKTGVLKGKADNPDVIIPSDTKIYLLFDQPITLVAQ